MTRTRAQFVCDRCGGVFPQWYGQCPSCGEWNSLGEMRGPAGGPRAGARRGAAPRPTPVDEVKLAPQPRLETCLPELDRVLGGGVVPGALMLVAGDPGLGKSTLLLQAASAFAERHGVCLYVSGEESLPQVAMRSRRLSPVSPQLLLLAETDIEAIEEQVQQTRPQLLVIDSIQAMYAPGAESLPGSASQVRDCALRMMRLAKDTGVPTFLVGHVTKDGAIAGPRVLEHMVDAVLALEGDHHSGYRILRAVKNRFGSTDEIGLFRMSTSGMEGVPDASAALLEERCADSPGSAVAAALEGSRPLLVEVQALVSQAPSLGTPRRSINGLDYNRTCMVIAVLERRAGLPMGDKDVFINLPGGVRVEEPATDLALALAMASSVQDLPLPRQMAFLGEVGLTGEVRSVPGLDRRLAELGRHGFGCCLVPPHQRGPGVPGIELVPVESVNQALERVSAAKSRQKA